MKSQNQILKFDVCLVSFSHPKNDARTLNLLRTIAKMRFSVCLIAFGEESDKSLFQELENVTFIPILESHKEKLWQRYLEFKNNTKQYLKLKAEFFIACDLYALPLARKLAFKSKAKLIYDSREIYSQLGTLSSQPVKQKILALIEKYLIVGVDEVLVSCDLDAKYLKKHFMHSVPYTTILNLPPYQKLENQNIIRDKYKIPNEKTILIYQGWLLEGRGIEEAIDSLEFLPNCILCIFGKGENENNLSEFAQSKSWSKQIIFCGTIPYDNLLNYTASADIGLALFKPISLSYINSLPNKLFEYIMAQIPVISTNLPAIEPIFAEYHIGKLVNKELNAKELSEAISEIIQNKKDNNFVYNLTDASQKYSYEAQENKIKALFDRK